MQWFWLCLVKLLIFGLFAQLPHIFKSLIHHFPENVHKLNHIMVFIWFPYITNTSINWNLLCPPPPFPSSPPSIWTLKIGLLKFPPQGKNCVQMPPPIFEKGKISKHDFLHIDKALKPRPSIPFFLTIFAWGSELFTLNYSTFKYIIIHI